MATFTQQEIDDAKQRQREGRGTPRDQTILEFRPGPAVPDNFDFSFLTPPSVEGYGEDSSGVGELPFRVPTPKPKNGQGPLEVQEEQQKEERQPKFDAQGRILNMLGLVAPMFLGTGVGALLGGRKGAKTGLQAGAHFSAGRMEGDVRRAEERRADEESAADLLAKQTAHLRALTESRKTASKDPILAEYLKQIAASRENPRVQLNIIESLPPEYEKHPSVITARKGAEARLKIDESGLTPDTKADVARMLRLNKITQEEADAFNKEIVDAREREIARDKADTAAKMREMHVQSEVDKLVLADDLAGAARFARLHGLGDLADDLDPDSVPLDPQDRFALHRAEDRLSGAYLRTQKEFRAVRDSYGRILAAGTDPSAFGDLALIFNYMKMLDPTSVVRESEFANAAATGAFGDRAQAWMGRVLEGKRLDDDMRKDLMDTAERLYASMLGGHRAATNTYRDISERRGYDYRNVVVDFETTAFIDQLKSKDFDPNSVIFSQWKEDAARAKLEMEAQIAPGVPGDYTGPSPTNIVPPRAAGFTEAEVEEAKALGHVWDPVTNQWILPR